MRVWSKGCGDSTVKTDIEPFALNKNLIPPTYIHLMIKQFPPILPFFTDFLLDHWRSVFKCFLFSSFTQLHEFPSLGNSLHRSVQILLLYHPFICSLWANPPQLFVIGRCFREPWHPHLEPCSWGIGSLTPVLIGKMQRREVMVKVSNTSSSLVLTVADLLWQSERQ